MHINTDPILITGVGRRIGLYMAQEFLARGLAVIGTFRTERASLDDLRKAGATLIQCDFASDAALQQLTTQVARDHQRLRAIIHNASEWLADSGELPAPVVMQTMMQVHVSAPYQINLALAALLQASRARHADIIHISDYVGSRGSKKHIAYAASKAAQDNLSLSFAASLAPKVKVNSIAPSLVMFNDDDDESYRVRARAKSLMAREAGLAEFMRTVDYLLESEYVTGRILALDGGRHLRTHGS